MITRNSKGQFVKGENIKDISGQRFGKLVVLELDKSKDSRKKYWLCQCDCGNIKSIRSDTLKYIQSCGCLKKEQDIINLKIINNHKQTNHKFYRLYSAIKYRCYNENCNNYCNYGGRGIKMCDEWYNDMFSFFDWCEKNYIEGYTIERINVNGNYEPSNCKFIPMLEQSWNKTYSCYITIDGVKDNITHWKKKLKMGDKKIKKIYKDNITYNK